MEPSALTKNKDKFETDLELFRDLINKSNDAIFVTDPQTGLFIFVNDMACANLGYDRQELLKMKVKDIEAIFPDNFSWETHVEALRQRGSYMLEGIHKRKNGSTFPVEINVSYVVQSPREYMVAVVRDITERKKVGDALRMRERQLAESQRVAELGSWEWNIVENKVTWSEESYRLFGVTPETFGGAYESFLDMVHPEDRAYLDQEVRRSVSEHDPYSIDARILRPSGEEWIMYARGEVIYDDSGTPVLMRGVLQDITKRKRTEEHTKDALNFISTMMESSPIGIVSIKATGAVVAANKAIGEIMGGTIEQLLKQNVRDLEAWKKCGLLSTFDEALSTNSEKRIETNYISTFGKHIWLSVRFVPYTFEGELHVLTLLADMNDRKRDEAEREKLQAQLLQAQKMESVGRLAGGVAHDFNNMLLAILGYAEMAMMEGTPSEAVHDYLKVIEQSALRSAALVRQLLAFARKQTVAPKILNLNVTVAVLLQMLQRLMGEDIDFAWMPGAGLWPVKIDPSQIDQLLANLCVNARDAIAGVGKITIETENAVFDEAYCAVHPGFVPGEYVMLAVSDNGCGMSKEVIDHLFEPFFTTKEAGKGTGLGLATVYGIVKQNDGVVDVYSEPGKGSTFKIYLPRFVGEAIEPAAASTAETPKGRGETVLLVEDEVFILNMSKEMLEALGYRVLTAGTPGEALRQAKAHAGEIQLLITDVVMPEMNGRDLAKLLSEINPGLKCLFSSGYTANVIAHRGVLDEGVHFLQKPFSRKDLATKAREALEQE